ncbi:MAG: polysaccharide deacetylase family protein [Nitrospirota bacterium]
MNIVSIWLKVKRSYKKNLLFLNAYRKKIYPDFVFDSHTEIIKDEIPVFTFHFIEPAQFEEQLQFLYANGYQTLTADEFYQMISGTKSIRERSVLLTFDDGWGSLWIYGYPLLRKYGMHGICFINPGMVHEGGTYFPNLVDLWEGRVSKSELFEREKSQKPLCTWEEIKKMAENGVIEFQSHTMYHSLVFTEPQIVDFFHPAYDTYINNYNIPIFRDQEKDNIARKAEWGMPIYAFAPRMAGKRRYLDDEELRVKCIEFVRNNGGKSFFKKQSWRKQLRQLIAEYRKRFGEKGYYESAEEQVEAIRWDLLESKRIIERKLPGKTVQHLCYPYFVGSELAVQLSREAGYRCNYWGLLEQCGGNRQYGNPYYVARLRDEFILRLPGRGRKSLLEILGHRIAKDSVRFFRNLIKSDYQAL